MITGPGMSNLHFNLLLAGLQEYSYEDDRLERISNYCSRWNNLGSSTKIPLTFARYNVRSMQVNEGYYLLALLRSEDGKHALHFGRLPSPDPLVQNHVEEPWKIVPNVPNYHALAICPVKDLLALAKIRSDRMCVCPRVPAIQFMLTVMTRLLEVFLFNMHTGEEYYETGDSEPTPKMVWNSGSLGEIDKVKLLLTSRRLAAVVKMSATQYNSVLVWDWEDGTLLVVSRFILLPKVCRSHGSVERATPPGVSCCFHRRIPTPYRRLDVSLGVMGFCTEAEPSSSQVQTGRRNRRCPGYQAQL